jgi:hypothetical protein
MDLMQLPVARDGSSDVMVLMDLFKAMLSQLRQDSKRYGSIVLVMLLVSSR